MRPVLRLVLIILMVLGLVMAAGSQGHGESGLGEAVRLLDVGQTVSSQYHGLLLAAVGRAEKAFADSYRGDGSAPLARLRQAAQHARAAAQELVMRAPADRATQQALDAGYRHMTAQLAALVQNVKCRCKLPSDVGDSRMVWSRYYQDR